MMRNTLPPLASNDLLYGVLLRDRAAMLNINFAAKYNSDGL